MRDCTKLRVFELAARIGMDNLGGNKRYRALRKILEGIDASPSGGFEPTEDWAPGHSYPHPFNPSTTITFALTEIRGSDAQDLQHARAVGDELRLYLRSRVSFQRSQIVCRKS